MTASRRSDAPPIVHALGGSIDHVAAPGPARMGRLGPVALADAWGRVVRRACEPASLCRGQLPLRSALATAALDRVLPCDGGVDLGGPEGGELATVPALALDPFLRAAPIGSNGKAIRQGGL